MSSLSILQSLHEILASSAFEGLVAINRIGIGDEGMRVKLGDCELLILPVHFLHSPGNFQVYDPISKILYSGDLGASLSMTYTVVSDFDEHLQYMTGFHRRYITSNKALRAWAAMVKQLDIDMILPQHGVAFANKAYVAQFIAWLEKWPCGVDLLPDQFSLPK